MAKPETMCVEMGCTRAWTREIEQVASLTLMAARGSTRWTKRVCQPCAEALERHIALEN
jgi:hypothetical protein